MDKEVKHVAIIVAHPDDETLWSGGAILSNPEWQCFIASLCRKDDTDRAPKFQKVLETLGADGIMGDLDDGPDQFPLNDGEVEDAVMNLLPPLHFDLVLTHSIYGEYTRHRRHEEIGKAVIRLWRAGRLRTKELRAFAFTDGGRSHLPVAIKDAPLHVVLPFRIWNRKYNIITKLYGFTEDSWEARSTPIAEAFWQFFDSGQAYEWLSGANLIS